MVNEPAVPALKAAIRGQATDRVWSQGVTLAREGAVALVSGSDDELEFEVRVPGRPTPFEVLLDAENEEWQCTCPSREAVCSHVVAAVLASEQGGAAKPRARFAVRYLLEPDPSGIKVERVLVSGEQQQPLVGSLLAKIAAGGASGIASQDVDLRVDQLLGTRAAAIIGDKVDHLLTALADARDVRWRGDPIKTSGEPVLPRAIVDDLDPASGGPVAAKQRMRGVRVRIDVDPIVRELAAVGVVRTTDDVLRPIGALDLAGAKLEKLPQIFDVPEAALPELIANTLPQLAQRIEVEIRTSSLPQVGAREQPRMQLDVHQDGERLSVFPTLVYGDPPRARGGSP